MNRYLAQVVTSDLIDRVPIAGGALVLMGIIGILTRLWLGSESRHRAELERIGSAHIAELETFRTEVKNLRAEIRGVRDELDAERKLRWRAQDVAAERVRRLRGGGQGERGERDAP